MTRFQDMFLSRREILRLGGLTATGYSFLPLLEPFQVRAAGRIEPRGSARFCIFVMLAGGPSHVDGWDLKEGSWTPGDFDIQRLSNGIKWPMSLYPRLAKRLDKVALIRSFHAWESQHGRGQYYCQAAHPHNPALAPEIPPVGAVVSSEVQKERRPTDSLPPYVAFNTLYNLAGLLGPGFLPATYAPFHINTRADLSSFAPPADERETFQRRWELLKRFDSRLRTDSGLEAKTYRDFHNFYEGAVSLMSDQRNAEVFQLDADDRKRYGSSVTGDAFLLSRNLVRADAGTRFIFLSQEDWDHHTKIFSDRKKHYQMSWDLDAGLCSLLDDLEATKQPGGGSLLDETLVVAMGEFGRTPGELSDLDGRDHYPYAATILFAGGGVQGDRVLGGTDELGAEIIDNGWSAQRPVYMEDVATTIYSAMGIDWQTKVETTPSGRAFYYVEPLSPTGVIANREITELFV